MAESKKVDIHVWIGQSQGVGAKVGDDVSAVPPVFQPNDYHAAWKQGTRSLRDISTTQLIVGAGLNAPMKFFLPEWNRLRNQKSPSIITNIAGSALLEAANGGNGFWQVDRVGSIYNTAIVDIQNFLNGIKLSPKFTGGRVIIHRLQGEQDGDNVNGTTVTGPLYKIEIKKELDAFKRDIENIGGFTLAKYCVYELGRRESDVSAAGWTEIRQAQNQFVNENSDIAVMIWDKAKELGPLVLDENGNWVSGWAFTDGLHYTAAAFKAMGQGAAINLHNILPII